MNTVTLNFRDYLQLLRDDFKAAFSTIQFSIDRNKEVLKTLKSQNIIIQWIKSNEIFDREEFVEKSMGYLKEAFEVFSKVSNAEIKPLTVTVKYHDYERLIAKCYNLNCLPRRYYIEN